MCLYAYAVHTGAVHHRYRDRAGMTAAEQATVVETLCTLEAAFEVHIPEGYNDKLEFMAHLWQPLRVLHKPLLVHLFSEASVLLTHGCLLFMGFRRHRVHGYNYWARGAAEPTAAAAEDAQEEWLEQVPVTLAFAEVYDADCSAALFEAPAWYLLALIPNKLSSVVVWEISRHVMTHDNAKEGYGSAGVEPEGARRRRARPLWRRHPPEGGTRGSFCHATQRP